MMSETAGPGRAAEWPETLDVDTLIANGWKSVPFQQFLLKMHSRCNLACDYCYMYTMPDQSWRSRPRMMTPALVSVVADRIAEHADSHSLNSVRVILHGGEPLLCGPERLADAARKIRGAVDARVRVVTSVQTNGTLLDEHALDIFETMGIRVGVSLDGSMEAHDRHRRYSNGHGSYYDVEQALKLLTKHPRIYSGLLSVIELDADPVESYEALLGYEAPSIDFLLPHHNWGALPPRPNGSLAPYADWLIAVFDRWYASRPKEIRIRFFEEMIHALLGGAPETEAIGLTPSSVIVVETDGSIEQSDVLKSAYAGAATTGLHIVRDSFNEALRNPHTVAMQLGADALGAKCQACAIKTVCGGGLYAHRYHPGMGFRNPSVYCPDLYHLISHVRGRLVEDLKDLTGTAIRTRSGSQY